MAGAPPGRGVRGAVPTALGIEPLQLRWVGHVARMVYESLLARTQPTVPHKRKWCLKTYDSFAKV